MPGWPANLPRPAVGTATGAFVAAFYGGLEAVVHFALHGRWDRGPAFAIWMTVAGAALGLVVGIVSASVRTTCGRPGDFPGRVGGRPSAARIELTNRELEG